MGEVGGGRCGRQLCSSQVMLSMARSQSVSFCRVPPRAHQYGSVGLLLWGPLCLETEPNSQLKHKLSRSRVHASRDSGVGRHAVKVSSLKITRTRQTLTLPPRTGQAQWTTRGRTTGTRLGRHAISNSIVHSVDFVCSSGLDTCTVRVHGPCMRTRCVVWIV